MVLLAIWWRLNVAVAIAGSYFVNPFTVVPVYFTAYRVGACCCAITRSHFRFHFTWNWLEHGLGPAWKPFLLGCLVCGIITAFAGRFALEFVWREIDDASLSYAPSTAAAPPPPYAARASGRGAPQRYRRTPGS